VYLRIVCTLFLIIICIIFPTLVATASADDARIKALEEQLKQQQEQNRQIMEMIKNMKGKQGPSAAATQPVVTPQQAQAEAQPSGNRFAPGWVAHIMAVEEIRIDSNDTVQLTANELGRFIATKPSYNYKDFTKVPGMLESPKVGWKGEAFFETKDHGYHSFIINVKDDKRILVSSGFIIEGTTIFNTKQQLEPCKPSRNEWENNLTCTSFTGRAELEPGRYKVEFWILAADGGRGRLNFEILTKKPSDATPVPANESLIVRVSK
jgi:hypothetical protein